jgi:hypothetical protein
MVSKLEKFIKKADEKGERFINLEINDYAWYCDEKVIKKTEGGYLLNLRAGDLFKNYMDLDATRENFKIILNKAAEVAEIIESYGLIACIFDKRDALVKEPRNYLIKR